MFQKEIKHIREGMRAVGGIEAGKACILSRDGCCKKVRFEACEWEKSKGEKGFPELLVATSFVGRVSDCSE